MKKREDFKVLIVYPNLAMMLVPSLAIAIFTRIFKREKYQTKLFDTTHYVSEENTSPQNRVKYLQAREFDENNDLGVRIKTNLLGDFREMVEDYKPDFIIFSVVEDAYRQTLSLLESIEDLNIPHLVGGVFPTAAPEVAISNPLINAIGIGEGEQVIVKVAERIRNGKTFEDVPSVWTKKDGKIIRNNRGPVVNMNEVIPDFSLFDEARFYRPMGGRIFKTIPVETYRGCPFTCTYCNSPMQVQLSKKDESGNFLRKKDFKVLREELKELVDKYNPDFFYFVDDSFTARNRKEVLEFCDMYEEFKLPFWFNTRPESTTLPVLKRLKEVGAYRISFGIESGNEQFRKEVLRRNSTNSRLHSLFEMINESGISYSLNLIIGFPGETRQLVMDTVEFVRTLQGYDTLTVSIFTPYHGTVLRDIAVKNKWLPNDYITKHTTSSSALDMPEPFLSSEEIDKLMRVLPLYTYFPKEDWNEIERAEIEDEHGNELLEKYSSIYKENFLKDFQEEDKNYIEVGGASGCKSNPLDSFKLVSPKRMDEALLDKLQASVR